ncbi:hypothetical protein [Pseudomonas sp. LRF_L74]|uniref:hypothetical protein n=1 Tax=Pseudomonas sp. LRF_L74 TaxID=3369422 RepID=UPI003F62E304
MSDDTSQAAAPAENASSGTAGDQERFEQLEKAGKANRRIIHILAGVLGLVVIVGITAGSLSLFKHTDPSASLASVEALQQKVGALEQQLNSLQLQVRDQEKLLALTTAPAAPPAVAPPVASAPAPARDHDDGKRNVQQVAKMLLGQEQSYQEALAGLKIGMTDLAGMIAGSRSWVDYYGESVDKQVAASRARVKNLQQWYSAEMSDDNQ